ncbi:MAG: class I SAM-dependent methyltransferase [Magnetococcales bacterium]|nr:class I SAM-dependent methyltransferase [Magnetococcales bacterium]MBF0321488.1 class I SAM-dependent methyltransferase [Magnetococcales bacterium]
MVGVEKTREFIATAQSHPGLHGARFENVDMFDFSGQYDFVCCLGTLTIFEDPEKPLRKLLDLCQEGG